MTTIAKKIHFAHFSVHKQEIEQLETMKIDSEQGDRYEKTISSFHLIKRTESLIKTLYKRSMHETQDYELVQKTC